MNERNDPKMTLNTTRWQVPHIHVRSISTPSLNVNPFRSTINYIQDICNFPFSIGHNITFQSCFKFLWISNFQEVTFVCLAQGATYKKFS